MINDGSPCQTLGVRILVVTSDNFSFSSVFVVFSFSVKKKYLPKGSVCLCVSRVKEQFGAFYHSFISMAFELTTSHRFVNEKPPRLSRNRIVKEER